MIFPSPPPIAPAKPAEIGIADEIADVFFNVIGIDGDGFAGGKAAQFGAALV